MSSTRIGHVSEPQRRTERTAEQYTRPLVDSQPDVTPTPEMVIAEHECIALSKLIAFSQDPNLIEERQIGLHKLCLEKWKVPVTERRLIPWPLLSTNRSAVIHGLLGDIFCASDCDQWERLDQVLPRLKPRLPPGTLVWGQPVNEYAVKVTYFQ
ncbi:unnamed protein product [Trichobilharzia regenti]|nr:unnamed protein product [Trichobilharzia regenti]